eukprot:maker-scaffold231_size243715-snap-gene-0.9 protein:Tk10028 transcript:maker-scaffold231_size243715-snap-gene-0.9-mRNA-1 annotation:"PREDICTED: uncharacterized protein LOC100906479"
MTRMYYFMLHLSSADILTALLTLLSELIWTFTSPKFYGGNFVCKTVKFLQMIGPYLRIETIPGTKGQLLQQKITNVLRRNPGMEVLQEASKVLKGNGVILPEGMSPDDVSKMKFCPTTSVDVERSFSQYKNSLSDRRHSFTKENI